MAAVRGVGSLIQGRSARAEKILAGLDLSALAGIEIGALDRPLVHRREGQVIYVDHAATATLRQKYAEDPNVNAAKIVDVDAVWGDCSMLEAVGRRADYVVASHVIEHVPDLIGWLAEIHDVLVSAGQLRLAVPDRRFTFDYLRQESRLSDILDAWLAGARKPLPHAILDHALSAAVAIDAAEAWQGRVTDPAPRYTFDAALALARDAAENGTYHDVHCWVFTPASFHQLMRRLAEAELLGFSCTRLIRTEPGDSEFFVHLRRCDDPVEAAASWQTILDAERDATAGKSSAVDPADRGTDDALRAECELLRHRLGLVLNSRSWRLTAPLRTVVEAWRKLRANPASSA
jgi:SAM-dependent methyltransferase